MCGIDEATELGRGRADKTKEVMSQWKPGIEFSRGWRDQICILGETPVGTARIFVSEVDRMPMERLGTVMWSRGEVNGVGR